MSETWQEKPFIWLNNTLNLSIIISFVVYLLSLIYKKWSPWYCSCKRGLLWVWSPLHSSTLMLFVCLLFVLQFDVVTLSVQCFVSSQSVLIMVSTQHTAKKTKRLAQIQEMNIEFKEIMEERDLISVQRFEISLKCCFLDQITWDISD